MTDHLDSIRESIKNGQYYSALFLAITMPSICGALESSDEEDSRERYISWYKKYIQEMSLTGEDCYYLRCSLLHQATTKHKYSSYSRVIFTSPVRGQPYLHNNTINNALNLDIPSFCNTFIKGAESWLGDVQNDPNYLRNTEKIIKTYPNGLLPFITGIPIIT